MSILFVDLYYGKYMGTEVSKLGLLVPRMSVNEVIQHFTQLKTAFI